MKCKYCDLQLEDSAKFCTRCGKGVFVENNKENKVKRRNIILASCFVIVSILIFATIIVAMFVNYTSDEIIVNESSESSDVSSSGEDVMEGETPAQPAVFDRESTYSPYLEYKKMPDIHNSVQSSDSVCVEIQEFVYTYNDAWIEYINNNSMDIYRYLRSGTYAYKYAQKYSRKNIVEEFEFIDVNDVRQDGNIYYVWTHEKINEYSSSGTRNLEYRWVYKIVQDVNGYYVENYTADPFYK